MTAPFAAVSRLRDSVRYELARLSGRPGSLRGAVLFAVIGAAFLTLPAARHMVALAQPLPPARHAAATVTSLAAALTSPTGYKVTPSVWATALLRHYSQAHGGGAWVVRGGVAGMVLPGAPAACAAAWLGATSVGYEYRRRGGLLTFVLLPRRFPVVVAKALVTALIGALLCLGATAAAYWTARLGFRAAGVHVELPTRLMLSSPREIASAALGGALGVVGAMALRLRLLAVLAALAGCALTAATLPRSTSLALPYLAEAARRALPLVPQLTYKVALALLPAVPLLLLTLAGLLALRRRRVV